jgi:antitoxin component YwqK of YwqJK toxin-antitoxin module
MIKYILLFITSISLSISINAQTEIDPNGYNVFYYENGQKSSEGNFLNGKPEGFWKNYFETGVLKSEGNRKDHLLDSTWLFYFDNGLLKEKVDYIASKKNGWSYKYSEEGFLLEQLPFDNDTIHGFGLKFYTDVNRVEFEEPYENGVLSGRGFQYARDGRIVGLITYEKGTLKSIQKINSYNTKKEKVGLWITYYDDISDRKAKLLEGRYKHGLKNGYFREYDRKGIQLSTTKYVNGQVVENASELMNVDLVREFYPDASVKWEKTYLGAAPHGIWKKYDTAGVVIETLIYKQGILFGQGIIDSKGIKQGHWKEYYNEGILRAEGDYKNGAKIGKWKFYHINQKLEQVGVYRKGGKPDGDWIWYYDNGAVKREETYFNGLEDGNIIEYNEEGEVIKKGQYVEGFKDGEWEINAGDYIEVGSYIEGMMHGLWKGTYKSTGKTAFKGEYIEDEPNDRHTFYYPTGRKMLEGKYQLGLKVGDWKRYDENGLVVLTIQYRNGIAQKISGKKVIGNEEE